MNFILRGKWSRYRAFLRAALAHEGLILLKLHIHIYFRYPNTLIYSKTDRQTETDRQTDRQRHRERQTDRQTDGQRERERQTDRQTDRQTETETEIILVNRIGLPQHGKG